MGAMKWTLMRWYFWIFVIGIFIKSETTNHFFSQGLMFEFVVSILGILFGWFIIFSLARAGYVWKIKKKD